MRNCKNCEHLVLFDYKNRSYSCEKWKCEFEPLKQEPKIGHWIEVTNGRGGHECDVCHDYAPSFQNGNEYLSVFCPNCGAKMAETEDI